MSKDNKKAVQETGRWLRVGVLTATMLGPFINAVAERIRVRNELLRQQAEALRDASLERAPSFSDSQERLAAVGTSLSEAFTDLSEQPYAKQLRKRGKDFSEEVTERGERLSHLLAERTDQVRRGLAERGSDFVERTGEVTRGIAERGSDLVERTSQATRDIAEKGSDLLERSGKASQELIKRSGEATKALTSRTRKQDVTNNQIIFWTTFTLGLVAAGVATYLLVRRRLVQPEVEVEQPIQLSSNGHVQSSTSSRESSSRATGGSVVQTATPEAPTTQASTPAVDVLVASDVPATQEQTRTSDTATAQHQLAHNAAFLGVVSTKRYYPVDTPLDQLEASADGAVDVIYFSSEHEAQAQGFAAAE